MVKEIFGFWIVILLVGAAFLYIGVTMFLSLKNAIGSGQSQEHHGWISFLRRKNKPSKLIPGYYYSVYWRYNRNSEKRMHRGIAKVTLFGWKRDQVHISLNTTDSSILVGSIDNKYLSGTWFSETGDARYHGVFQFVSPRGSLPVVFGKWLGFNGTDRINCGIWALIRVPEIDTGDSAQKLIHELKSRIEGQDTPPMVRDWENKLEAVLKSARESDLSMSLGDARLNTEEIKSIGSDRQIEK